MILLLNPFFFTHSLAHHLRRAGQVNQIQRTEKIENQMTEKMTKGPKMPKTIRPNSTVLNLIFGPIFLWLISMWQLKNWKKLLFIQSSSFGLRTLSHLRGKFAFNGLLCSYVFPAKTVCTAMASKRLWAPTPPSKIMNPFHRSWNRL